MTSFPDLVVARVALFILAITACVCLNSSTVAGQDNATASVADPQTYLAEFSRLCQVDWPKNRTMTVVCHGHSVPAGYARTPEVKTMDAYPHLLHLHAALCRRYPHSVINVIVTAIGGEQSEQGAARFDADVLNLKPDVITIDYALNDRRIGLERVRKAWVSMIGKAQAHGIKVLLLTPTPDLRASLDDPTDPLNQQAEQIRHLARTYHVGLVDSLAAFQKFAKDGGHVATLMAQGNHPNAAGHRLVAEALMAWFR